ncbi:Copper-transporting P-type ATPase [Giardia lamblia P15]|uniref:Copper-transporting P-type ATPase n=1 Tax=Giardia intestinalis (strain P15) TaxID=658858 RepID=E1F2C3_GIAIA|nr:Copper-transporting P-type ATPase [Giardia lamblia P15]
MDDFNPNPALHLTNGKKVRLPIDSKFRDTTADFTFPSSSIREKVARKVFYKLSLPAELLAFESVPAVAILVTLSALVTEDDYSKVVSILNSDLRLKTIYGNFVIVCACVSYEKLWGFIVAQVPRNYNLPQQRVVDLAAAVLSKYTGITLSEANPSICALTGTVTDPRFTEFDVASQGNNDILTLVHCGRFYNYLAQKSLEENSARTPLVAQAEQITTSSAIANLQGTSMHGGSDSLPYSPDEKQLRVYENLHEIPLELLAYAAFQLADGDPSRIVYFNSHPVTLLYMRNATINEPLERFYGALSQWPLCAGGFAEVDNHPISEFRDRSSCKYYETAGRGRSISSSQNQMVRRNSRSQKDGTPILASDLSHRNLNSVVGRQQNTSNINSLSYTQRIRLESKGRVYIVLFLKRLIDYHSDLAKDSHKYLIKSGRILTSSTQQAFLSCTVDFTDRFKEICLSVGGITDNSCVRIIENLLLDKSCRDIKIDVMLGTVLFLAVPAAVPAIINKIKAMGFTCKLIAGTDVADEARSLLINNNHLRKWIIQAVINSLFLLLTLIFSFGHAIFPTNAPVNSKLNASFVTVSDTLAAIFATLCVLTNSGYLIIKYGMIALCNKTFSNESMLAFILFTGLVVSINAYGWSLGLKQESRIPLMFDSLVILITMVSFCKIIELKAKQLSARPYINLAQSIPTETVIVTELLIPEVVNHFFKDANNLLEPHLQEDTDTDTTTDATETMTEQHSTLQTVQESPSKDADINPRFLLSDIDAVSKPASIEIASLPSSDSIQVAMDSSDKDISLKVTPKHSFSPRGHLPNSAKSKGTPILRKSGVDDSISNFTGQAHSTDTSIISPNFSYKRNPLYNLLIKKYQIDKIVEHLTGNYNESFAQYKFANAQTRSLTKGMIVRVQAGYRCPCDGVVVYGSTEVDERYISGRRMMSAVKNMGDVIYAGTRVLYSDLYVCCVMINQDTIIGRIFSLLQRSQKASDHLPRLHRISNKILDIMGPLVLGLGVLLLVIWLAASFTSDKVHKYILELFVQDSKSRSSDNLIRTIFSFNVMLAFFIAGCSSALAVAIPILSLSGSTRAQKMGLLMRNSCLLSEQLASVEHVVFSKSGTLTLAQPIVESILIPFNIDAMFAFFEATGQLVHTCGGYMVKRPVKLKEPETLATISEESYGNGNIGSPSPSFVIASADTIGTTCAVAAVPLTTEESEANFPGGVDTSGPLLSMFAQPGQERRMSAKTIDALNAVVAVGDLGSIDLVMPREEDSVESNETVSCLHKPVTTQVIPKNNVVNTLRHSESSVLLSNDIHRLSSPLALTPSISSTNLGSFDIPSQTFPRTNSMPLHVSLSMSTLPNIADYMAKVYTKDDLCAAMNTDIVLGKMRDKFIYSVAIKCLKYYATFAHHSGNSIIYSLLTCIILFAKGRPMDHIVRNISNLSEFSLPEAKDFEMHQDRGGFSATMGGEEIYCGNFYHEKKDTDGPLSNCNNENSGTPTENQQTQQYVRINPQTFRYEFINTTNPEQLESMFDNHDYAALYIRGELISTITVSDTVRPDSQATISRLKKRGYNVYMITADTQHSAFKVSDKVEIPRECVIHDLPVNVKPDAIRFLALHDRWPTQKEIAMLSHGWKADGWEQKQQKVLFVCDGINDISCLPACGVSVAVGSGEQILKNSADIVLMSNHLSDMLQMFHFAETVRKFMIAVFIVTILYSTILLILTSGILVPVPFVISPTYSALAITGLVVCVTTIGLSLNLYCEG